MRKCCMFFGMLLLVCVNVAGAEEIVVVTETFAPYSYEENGQIEGVSTAIVKAAIEKAGVEAKFRLYPWARAYKMAQEQENVLIYSMIRSEEREHQFKWIGPIVPPLKLYFFKLADRDDIMVESLEDAKQYRTGIPRNDYTHGYLLERGFDDKKHFSITANDSTNIQMLFAGRIDLIVGPELPMALLARSAGHQYQELERLALLLKEEDGMYMAFSQQTPDELVEQVRAAFSQIQSEGIPAAIMEDYLKSFE